MEAFADLEELGDIKYIRRWMRWTIACLMGIGMVYLSEPDSWAELHLVDGYLLAILVSCFISIGISKLINYTSIALDRRYNWFKRPFYRIALQLSLGVAFPIAAAVLFIWIYFTANNYSLAQTTYLERVFIAVCAAILITNAYYTIHYLVQVLQIVARKRKENQFIIQEQNQKLEANAVVVLNEPTVGDTVAEPMLDEQIAPKTFTLPSLVPVAEIAVIVSVGRDLFCYDVAGKRWSWTLSLNHTILGLPTEDFYQVSKSCIVSRKNIIKAFRTNSRSALLLLASPKDHYALVSYRENTIFGLWYKLRVIVAKRSDFKNIEYVTAKKD